MNKLILLSALVLLLFALPSSAQTVVCVHNSGAFAAQMKLAGSSGSTAWSEGFAAGQWRCQKLDDSVAKDGAAYQVEVHAVGGSTLTCDGVRSRVNAYTASVTYETWGSTTLIRCQMPGEGL